MIISLGGGGGGTKTNLIREGSAPRSEPLPFYIPLLAEKIPLLCTFHCQMVLLLYTSHGEIETLPTNLFNNTRLVRKLQKKEVFCHFNAAFK